MPLHLWAWWLSNHRVFLLWPERHCLWAKRVFWKVLLDQRRGASHVTPACSGQTPLTGAAPTSQGGAGGGLPSVPTAGPHMPPPTSTPSPTTAAASLPVCLQPLPSLLSSLPPSLPRPVSPPSLVPASAQGCERQLGLLDGILRDLVWGSRGWPKAGPGAFFRVWASKKTGLVEM